MVLRNEATRDRPSIETRGNRKTRTNGNFENVCTKSESFIPPWKWSKIFFPRDSFERDNRAAAESIRKPIENCLGDRLSYEPRLVNS